MWITRGWFLCWRRRGWSIDRRRTNRQLWPLCLSLSDAVHHGSIHYPMKYEEVAVPQTSDSAD